MRIALCVEYDGSRFSGWQMQNHGTRTVQAVLQKALSIVANETIQVVCAGRTDTGVHATGQVVHFDCSAERSLKAWVMGVNTHLPDDVAVRWSAEVGEDFSARFTATARQYRYVISNRQSRPALLHNRVCWRHGPIDVAAMHQAAQALLGENDYSSFRSSACQAEHARRNIQSISVQQQADYIYLDIQGNAFLHHMVRNIVGSLLMVGNAEKPIEWMAELLQLKDRTQAGPTAIAAGLYLVNVYYPDELGLPEDIYVPEF